MIRVFKWAVISVSVLALLLAAAVLALNSWVRTDDFRLRLQQQASAAVGVPVVLGGVAVALWPLPAVALSDVVLQSRPPLSLERLEVRPRWLPLLQGRLVVATLLVRRAVLPQRGIDAVLALQKKRAGQAAPAARPPATDAPDLGWLPRSTVLEQVSWISATGARTTFDAHVAWGEDALPQQLTLALLDGNLRGLRAELVRQADAPPETGRVAGSEDTPAIRRWALQMQVGGGQVDGVLSLQQPGAGGGAVLLKGRLQTRGVEVSALTAPARTLTGRLDASTSLNARAATTAALAEGLHSQTTFTVRDAVIHGIDLAKAVQTVGLSRGGQTRLDTLAGQVNTQGRAVLLSNLVASSGVLAATGQVALSPAKTLNGRVIVNAAGDSKVATAIGSAVGIPLTVGGTLDQPEVTLSRSALVGAAIGTALLPGVGTGAGANLGDRVGEGFRSLFGK